LTAQIAEGKASGTYSSHRMTPRACAANMPINGAAARRAVQG
jgi:hypothetical protein